MKTTLMSQLAMVQDELASKTEALKKAESASNAAAQEKAAAKELFDSQLSSARAEIESKTSEAQSASDARDALQSKVSALQGELQAKHEALELAQASTGSATDELQSSLDAARQRALGFETDLEALRAELAALRAELADKTQALTASEQNASAARTELQEKLEKSLEHARAEIQQVTEKHEEVQATLLTDVESLKANLESAETRNAVMEEELRLTNEALNRSSVEASGIESVRTQLAEVSERFKESEMERSTLEQSLRVANERLTSLEERLKVAEENDASAAEALREANEQAAKAKDNVASIASVSATQFAQERQMMKNALSELQTERDILVKMLKTFHAHGVVHSTSETASHRDASESVFGDGPSEFARRFTDSASLAGVFTPRKRAPYVDLDRQSPNSPRSPN
jgi:chromosome segregation ATPase